MKHWIFQKIGLLIFLGHFCLPVRGQEMVKDLKPLYEELDSLFAEESVPENLFELTDSLLALEETKISALSLRVGYVSQIVSAGRTWGFDQYGLSPAATYFHHSGIMAGVTGYYSSEFDPAYYLTDLNIGYMHTLRKFTFQINHDFYLYNDTLPGDHPFNKNIHGAISYNRKYISGGADYSFLYGKSNAHRITAHVNGTIRIKLKGIIDAVTFMPGAAFQWGNADVYYWRQPKTALTDLYRIIRQNNFPTLDRGDYWKLTYLLEKDREAAATYFLRQRDYSTTEIEKLFETYYEGTVMSNNTFGFMNLSLSIPVIIRSGNFSLLLNYTYNQPQRLPGETFSYEPSGYFSSSLSYLISWIKK